MKDQDYDEYLSDHLVLKNLFFVENLDSYILTDVDIPSKLDLCEIALAQGSTKLVLPHTCPTVIVGHHQRRLRCHLLSLNLSKNFLSLQKKNTLSSSKIEMVSLYLSLFRANGSRPLLLARLPHLRLCHALMFLCFVLISGEVVVPLNFFFFQIFLIFF